MQLNNRYVIIFLLTLDGPMQLTVQAKEALNELMSFEATSVKMRTRLSVVNICTSFSIH